VHRAMLESATLSNPCSTTPSSSINVRARPTHPHADPRRPDDAKATALLLADLGVTKSHSRPYTSNDNPFSESHFKTLKYQPQFPQRSAAIEDAKTFCRSFFDGIYQDHHHGWHRPDARRTGPLRSGRRGLRSRQKILGPWPFNLTQNASSRSRQNRRSQPPPGSTRQPNGLRIQA